MNKPKWKVRKAPVNIGILSTDVKDFEFSVPVSDVRNTAKHTITEGSPLASNLQIIGAVYEYQDVLYYYIPFVNKKVNRYFKRMHFDQIVFSRAADKLTVNIKRELLDQLNSDYKPRLRFTL